MQLIIYFLYKTETGVLYPVPIWKQHVLRLER